MPFCVAVNCSNQTENNSQVSFHVFPKDKALRKAWEAAIGRTSLPASGRLCSDHFTAESYEITSVMKLQLCKEEYSERKSTRRRLKKGAIPTIFSHRDVKKGRCTSSARTSRVDHAKVSNIPYFVAELLAYMFSLLFFSL